MQMRRIGACLSILFSLFVYPAEAQLFYNSCAGSGCVKAYAEKKGKLSEGLYWVETIFLTYRQRDTTDADEKRRNAKVYCNRNRPTVTWDNGKALRVDKSAFAKPLLKKGKLAESEKRVEYDETSSLWKKICPMH